MHIPIHNLADARLEPYRNLKQQGHAAWAGMFVTEGDKLTRRLLASGLEVHSLLVGRLCLPSFAARVPAGVPVYIVADEEIERIIGFNFHRGILGCGIRPPAQPAAELLQRLPAGAPGERTTVLVCADVQDPDNLGSMLRTAGALGVAGAVLSRGCADPYSRRVLRVSMGTVFRLPLAVETDLSRVLPQWTADYGLETWATVTDRQAEPLELPPRPPRLAVVFGSEAHGLPPELVAACQRRVTIPIHSGIDSLNVSVAAGIILYHLQRNPS